MSFKPEKQLKVEDWWYLPQLDKLAKLNSRMEVCEQANLDHLCQSVLNFFLLNPGRLISKEELLKEVWNMTSVTDGRVARVISILRDVLGDSVKSPRYIETIPKRGYRFIAKVIEQEQIVIRDPAAAEEPLTAEERKKNLRWWASLITATALLATFASWLFWPDTEFANEQVPFVKWNPVSSKDGFEYYPALSADNQFLAYSYKKDKNSPHVLMLQNLMNHQSQQLTNSDADDYGVSFRPDGKAIAYQRLRHRESCEIRLLTFLGLPGQSEWTDELLTHCGKSSVSSRLSWAADGGSLIYTSDESSPQRMAIYSLDLVTKNKTQLVLPSNTGMGDFTARYSNSGDKIAFLRDVASHSVQIWLMDLASGETSLLLHLKDSYPGDIAWSPDDQFIYYPAQKWSIEAVNTKTGAVKTVALTDNHAYEILLGKNGELYGSIGAYANYYVKKMNNPMLNTTPSDLVVFKSNRSERLVEENPVHKGPTAAVSKRTGLFQIWLFYPDGRQQMISHFTNLVVMTDLKFSPDGQQLLALVDQQVWVFDLQGGSQLISKADEVVKNMSWGKDTDSVFYTTYQKGRWQLMHYSLTMQQVTLHMQDVDFFLQSRSGKYQLQRNATTGVFSLLSGQGEEILPDELQSLMIAEATIVLWDNGIYFSGFNEDQQSQLYFYAYNTKQITPLDLKSELYSSRFSLSHDGQFIFVVVGETLDIDIAKLELTTIK
ncbi:winged helix-turn-helix domain-containing protein [Rheinheimera soli]|uniref:DNA-binding winged helix-turn-helix (WHTH) protein/Tol biopolymer transport system component n=1 Tax=Rheinheimera soli TaxID=443616 RepID=A0ABU1VXP8_9GAMM|nr:winged helix-turn-helix domain-containing protein [Rheinheimera soli]MDR7120491.1 DNA-binding winged helix-turn-helix (wHTH) protein/Tol biopolymer transport system component [Rheinheimera soli]